MRLSPNNNEINHIKFPINHEYMFFDIDIQRTLNRIWKDIKLLMTQAIKTLFDLSDFGFMEQPIIYQLLKKPKTK
jgi:hypothetical protein